MQNDTVNSNLHIKHHSKCATKYVQCPKQNHHLLSTTNSANHKGCQCIILNTNSQNNQWHQSLKKNNECAICQTNAELDNVEAHVFDFWRQPNSKSNKIGARARFERTVHGGAEPLFLGLSYELQAFCEAKEAEGSVTKLWSRRTKSSPCP